MKRKLGIGLLSLVLVIIAIFWCCNINVNVQEQQEAYINEINKEYMLSQNKVTTIDIEKSFLTDKEERQCFTLNQEETYVIMSIIQDLYFTDETCDGIAEYIIKINTQDNESLNMFSVEIYDKEVHLLKNSEEAVLTEEQSNKLKRIIEKYFNK